MATADKSQDAPVAQQRLRRLGAWLLGLLPLCLLLAAIVPQGGALRAALRRNLANRPYLIAAMTADGQQSPLVDGLTPHNGLQARALAAVAQQSGNPSDAVRWLVGGAALADPGALTRFEACRLFATQGRIAEAREFCRDEAATAPYWMAQGIAADEAGRPAEAIAYFDLARTAAPNLLSAWERLGRAYFQADRATEAIAVYEHLLDVQPRPLADTYYQLGTSYLALGQLDAAREALELGLTRYPYQRELHLALADTARAAGDLAAADDWYARLLQQQPGDAYAWAGRGEVAMQRGLPEQALLYLTEAASLEPEAVGYWLSLAAVAAAADDSAQAAAAYEKAIALRPADVDVLLAAAHFFAEQGQTRRARALWQQVLALEPDNSAAAEALAGLTDGP